MRFDLRTFRPRRVTTCNQPVCESSPRVSQRLTRHEQCHKTRIFGSPPCRGFVKKRRRVEFHIEHREVTIFAGQGAPAASQSASPAPDSSGLLRAKPEICPACGSSPMIPLADSFAALGTDLSTLQQRMNDGTVHLHYSPQGDWWICTQSLHRS